MLCSHCGQKKKNIAIIVSIIGWQSNTMLRIFLSRLSLFLYTDNTTYHLKTAPVEIHSLVFFLTATGGSNFHLYLETTNLQSAMYPELP